MRYTPKDFYNSMPNWKRKKDPILTRIFYRPLSYVFSTIFANLHISANVVSYMSLIVGVVGCSLFFIPSHTVNIVGACLVNFWGLLDCCDGNLARTVKKEPYGEFADGISSYVLVGLLCTSIGFAVYRTGGILVDANNIYFALMGTLASSSDSMMRLVYQKFINNTNAMVKEGVIKEVYDKHTDKKLVNSLRVKIENEIGIGGILPVLILLATTFNLLDLIVIYCLVYYGLSFLIVLIMYIFKAIKIGHINNA